LKRARKADVIFAQDPVSVGLPAAIAAKILRKKFILKVVGDYAWEQHQVKSEKSKAKSQGKIGFLSPEDFQEMRFDWLTELRRIIERRVACQADKIIVPSEYLKKIVEKWGVNANKINVIYNAFDAPKLNSSKEEARKKLTEIRQLKADTFLIVSAGRLVPWKGFKTLIGIMPKILKEIPSAKLFIIGSGPDREALETVIANYGLRNNVFLLGQLPREDLLLLLRAGDVFVLNTGYEGFSHQLLEAMAVGIPVITTNIGGNPEMIENGETGLLFEYDNKEEMKRAILELRENLDLKNKIVQNAKQKVSEFGKERMLAETISVLSQNIRIRKRLIF